MKRTVRTGAALLLPLLIALPAMAQEPARDPLETPSAAVPGAEEADGGGRTADQSGPEAGSPAGTAPGNPAPEPGKSPFDYRPSEQISEDLSVSFPVDI